MQFEESERDRTPLQEARLPDRVADQRGLRERHRDRSRAHAERISEEEGSGRKGGARYDGLSRSRRDAGSRISNDGDQWTSGLSLAHTDEDGEVSAALRSGAGRFRGDQQRGCATAEDWRR